MKRLTILLLSCLLNTAPQAQQTAIYTDPMRTFHDAKEYFQQERYSLAYPLFLELQRSLRETDRVFRQISSDEISFYATVCALRQNEPTAEADARAFIDKDRNQSLSQKMGFHLGSYYFRKGDLRSALIAYGETDVRQLSNREIADMKFNQGYAHFSAGDLSLAKPLFNSVRQLPDHPNQPDANYYYGYICYSERRYSEALEAFRKVESHPEYGKAVPFYIASILYNQGEKDKALAYAEANASKARGVYGKELDPFLGHAYFEKRQFSKALPYLEAYSKNAEKLTRGQLYELSYCHYATGNYGAAAEGFSQMSSGTDSLTQSAMYLLGDSYLRLGRKAEARNAFAYCASNSSVPFQREVSAFNYAKLSYELGYQDMALTEMRKFLARYPNSPYAREGRELMVNILANTNNYREALDMLESLSSPTESSRQLYPKVAYGRAMELVNDQDLAGAERLLDKVIRDPNERGFAAPARFWKGEIAYRTQRPEEAIRSFTEYLSDPSPVTMGEANPRNARYNLGYAYLRMENYKAAQGQFEPIARNAGTTASGVEQDAYLREADCHYMLRDFTRSKAMYQKASDNGWPASDYAQYQLAMIAGVTKPADKTAMLAAFERKYPSSELVPQVNMEIAATYLSDERYREAIPYLNKVTAASGNAAALKPRAYLRLGIAHYNLDNNKAALDNYRKLVTDYPQAPETDEALESARAIYVEEGRTAEYADFLRAAGRSISQSEEDSLAWSVVETRYASKDMNAAMTAVNDYLKRFPEGGFTTDALFYRAEISGGRKDWKAAAADYEAVADRGAGKYAERASQQAGRINYFELQDHVKAEKYFAQLKSVTVNRETRLDAMRGLLRSQYQLRKWNEAVPNAQELLKEKSIGTDDRILATMVVGRSHQSAGRYQEAIAQFRSVVSLSNAAYAAEARYEIADCHFRLKDLKSAEKAAMETINKSGSYDYWITKAYILLGEIFWKQKDYFNAKATLQSVVENSRNAELKEEAKVKLELVTEEERKNSKISDK